MKYFILKLLASNLFLRAIKIANYILKAQLQNLKISEINIRNFLTQKVYELKSHLLRVKMKLSKTTRLYFENKKKIETEAIYFFIDESSFYLRISGINK